MSMTVFRLTQTGYTITMPGKNMNNYFPGNIDKK